MKAPGAITSHTVAPRAFLRVAQVTLGLVVLNIVSGGAVRLTDSGLGCPDWPTCSQHHLTPPLGLHPVMEFGNRMVVVALCVAAGVTVLCALVRAPRRGDLTALSAGLIGGIVAEAVLGGIVVYSKLNPYAVMTHFMVGIGLLTVACALVFRAGRAPGRGTAKVASRLLWAGRFTWGLLLLAVAAGTATTAAGPHAGGAGAKRLPVPLTDMARTHSGIVIVAAAAVLVLLYLLEHAGAPESVKTRGRVLLAAMVLQGVVGYTQYFSHLPAWLVGVHVFGVTLVWSAMYWFVDGLRHHAPEVLSADVRPTVGLAPAGLEGVQQTAVLRG
ncbi:MAG TPA: COX15/CtaA family protein [Acidimicrobiales bacterium]|nr:COX15/CtaA family protein [Acidimicrobiales bacterium]